MLTHDELLEKIVDRTTSGISIFNSFALKAVVELHKPNESNNCDCQEWAVRDDYPCNTIQVIEKELS